MEIVMSLTQLHLPEVMNTSYYVLSKDFFIPVLKHSIRYDRGVGFFTSGWIKATAQGLVSFIESGGVARWITSPMLNEQDAKALAKGVAAWEDEKIFELLVSEVDNLTEVIERDLLLALAWMVADQRLVFKIAIPTEKLAGGDFHDKFGIFTDKEGNKLSFNGSYNDTARGELNYESIKIFKSWQPYLGTFVEDDATRFNDLWHGRDPNLRIYDLPASIKRKIIKYREFGERPYDLPPVAEIYDPVQKQILMLRPYQDVAVQKWIASDFKGIFEMATGTGKTITSLFCVKEFFSREPYGVVVILCPLIHLVTQWKEEVDKFNIDSVLCFGSSKDWIPELQTKIQSIELAETLKAGEQKNLALICTNATFFSDKFLKVLASTKLNKMILADEVHNIGTEFALSKLPSDIVFRLALSATPERFGDQEGTERLFVYFGGVICTLDLHDAIFKLNVLSHYVYEIHEVQLTEKEFKEYRELTRRIAQLITSDFDNESSPQLSRLLLERANLLNRAAGKVKLLRELLAQNSNIKKTLFYCAPGQIDEVNQLLTKELNIISHRITYREDRKKRAEIIKNFENDNYQALTAIRCLDEGVDIPVVECAFILASSSNPREFIQRRGRILRKAEGKKIARIVDIMARPPEASVRHEFTEAEMRIEKSILSKELRRIHYFASCADNRNETLSHVYDIASEYNLQHILLGADSEYRRDS
jgi:superfamily II DNA or RNA helicase